MRKVLLTLVLVLSSVTGAKAQNNTTRFFIAYDYENLTVDTTVGGVPFTASKVTNSSNPIETAQLVTFTVACSSGTSCPVRFTIDGTAPTTSVGLRIDYGTTVSIYNLTNISAFRAIREGATSAILNVTYLR